MSRLAILKAATSLKDVAHLLGYSPKAVSYLLYKLSAAQKYTTFEIPKKNGGESALWRTEGDPGILPCSGAIHATRDRPRRPYAPAEAGADGQPLRG